MASARKLYERAQQSPNNFRFQDFRTLMERVGFQLDRTKGSHFHYIHRDYPEAKVNIQDWKGQSKAYQVRQVLAIIDDLGLLGE